MNLATLRHKGGQLLGTLMPARVIQSQLHRRVFMRFAEKIGLVYFGYVDQRSDDHRLIRGLTVSARHRDNHYCVGAYKGYDVALVERSDTIHFPRKPSRAHTWIVMTFDLHTSKDIPHIFIGLHSHNETFYAHLFTKFSQLSRSSLGHYGQHDARFTQRYALFTEPAHVIAAEQLFNPAVTKLFAEMFAGLTVEVADHAVYVYAEHARPTQQLLERMLVSGAWLAEVIDQTAYHVLE